MCRKNSKNGVFLIYVRQFAKDYKMNIYLRVMCFIKNGSMIRSLEHFSRVFDTLINKIGVKIIRIKRLI